jgi:hypothetical protein
MSQRPFLASLLPSIRLNICLHLLHCCSFFSSAYLQLAWWPLLSNWVSELNWVKLLFSCPFFMYISFGLKMLQDTQWISLCINWPLLQPLTTTLFRASIPFPPYPPPPFLSSVYHCDFSLDIGFYIILTYFQPFLYYFYCVLMNFNFTLFLSHTYFPFHLHPIFYLLYYLY